MIRLFERNDFAEAMKCCDSMDDWNDAGALTCYEPWRIASVLLVAVRADEYKTDRAVSYPPIAPAKPANFDV